MELDIDIHIYEDLDIDIDDVVQTQKATFWHLTSPCFQTADWRRVSCECRPVSGSSREGICLCTTPTPAFPYRASHRSGGTQPLRLTPNLFHLGLVCNKMPFPTRPLQPSSLGRGPPPPGEEPLQWVTNQNLCQAMRQLVSLLKQADSMFGDLEVRGKGCLVNVVGRVLLCDGSNPCAQRETETLGLKGHRTQL